MVGGERHQLKKEPFVGVVRWGGGEGVKAVEATITFHAHYGEPPLKHKFSVAKATSKQNCKTYVQYYTSLVFRSIITTLSLPPPLPQSSLRS